MYTAPGRLVLRQFIRLLAVPIVWPGPPARDRSRRQQSIAAQALSQTTPLRSTSVRPSMNSQHFIEGDRVRLRRGVGSVPVNTRGTMSRALVGGRHYNVQFDGYPELSLVSADDVELLEAFDEPYSTRASRIALEG